MKRPTIQVGDGTLMGLGTYTLAHLKADAEAKDLAAVIQPVMDALKEAGAHRAAAELLVMTSMAMRDRSDFSADQLLREIFHDVKALEGGTRPGPRGKLFFPKGLPGIIGCSIPDQSGMMRTLAGILGSDTESRFSGRVDAVDQKADDLEEKVAAYDDATTQASVAYGEVLRARAEFIRAYEKVYAQLLDRFGKRRAESFFQKANKKRKPKKPAA